MNTKLVVGSVFLAVVTFYWLKGDYRFDPKSITQQRILVTGASSGIGEELAYQYAKLGARLVITARREPLLKEVVKKCQDLGAERVDAFPADMAKPEERDQLIQFTRKTLGGLDQLILNHASIRHKFWKGDTEDLNLLRQDMEVNFISYVDLASKALPMLKEVKGRIGVVSSVTGKLALIGCSHYGTTKFALQGFFASLRPELKYHETGVSVTLCVLGFINTDTAVQLTKSVVDDDRVLSLAAPVVDTALAIIKGVNNRVDEMYYPCSSITLITTVNGLFPEYLERYVLNPLFKNKFGY